MANLFEKIYGCLVGSRVASAMAVPTEGWDYQDIQDKWGLLQDFLTPEQIKEVRADRAKRMAARYGNNRPKQQPFAALRRFPVGDHEPEYGMTEDGIERQKPLVTAIIEKKGRITIEDWAEVIKRDTRLEQEQHLRGSLRAQEDVYIYPMIRGDVTPCYAGALSPWPGTHGYARSCHPLGLINAGNPWQASRDALDVGMMMYPRYGAGIWGAACYAAAIAEALKKDATRDSVVDAAMKYGGPMAEWVEQVMAVARECKEPFDLRKETTEWFRGWGMWVEENVAVAIGMFYLTYDNPKGAIVAGVNWGRDTDCQAAMAAGLAGALTGPGNIPQSWIETVEEATRTSKATLYRRTMDEEARGIHGAVKGNIELLRNQIASLEL